MVKTVRILLMLLAALFLSRGPEVYGASMPGRVFATQIEFVLHGSRMPTRGYRIEKQCSKAGCVLVPYVTQSPTLAILPDCQINFQPPLAAAYELAVEISFEAVLCGPLPPPPKSLPGQQHTA